VLGVLQPPGGLVKQRHQVLEVVAAHGTDILIRR
jgi:hypothetical protein